VDGRDYTGLGYVASELARRPLLAAVGLAAPIALAFRAREARVAIALATGVVAFVVLAGGDWMPNRRLLVPALPLAAIAAAIVPTRVRTRVATWCAACGAILFAESAATTDRALDQRWRSIEWLDRRLESFRPTPRPFAERIALDWMPTHLLRQIAPYVAP